MKKDKQEQGRQLTQSLRFKVAFEGQPQGEVKLVAYAFDNDGELLASAPVTQGEAQLALHAHKAMHARIMLAPVLPEGRRQEQPTAEVLERLRAYEPMWKFEPRKDFYELLPIPEFNWRWWLFCLCRVRGRVVRPVTINGVTHDKPVCHARVHICEVDNLFLIIPRLPDDLIIRIREELINPRPPGPDPDPWFRLDPSVIDLSPINLARMQRQPDFSVIGDAPQLEAALPNAAAADASIDWSIPNPQALLFKGSLAAELSAESKAALQSSSLTIVRQALLDNIALIRPYLCWWSWLWPYFYTCDELAVLETDNQGRFDTTIIYLCTADHPDLYFWVEYCIGGAWTTVYSPAVACNTYWNYVCNSEVTIRISDPRVPWCGSDDTLPGKQVAVVTIGNNISMAEIQGQSAGANEGLSSGDRPFGGRLEPHVWFGEDLRLADITHYRWSYRRMDGVDTWHILDRQVVRHYAEVLSDGTLHFKPFLLGPDPAISGQGLFKIRPANPLDPLPAGVVSASWAPEVDARENTASAFFMSHQLEAGDALAAAGKYELKLELFKSDGSLVNWTAEGVLPKVPTIAAPFGPGIVPTVAPAPEHLILNAGGDIVAFRLVLHVDNNKCSATLYPVTVDGSSVANECGFASYADKDTSEARIQHRPFHPNNFGTFTFRIRRGTTSGIVEHVNGRVGITPIEGYTRNAAGVYSKDIPAGDLLGDCDRAAFAETLYVNALATDGWSTLDYLDSGLASAGFALEPAGS